MFELDVTEAAKEFSMTAGSYDIVSCIFHVKLCLYHV